MPFPPLGLACAPCGLTARASAVARRAATIDRRAARREAGPRRMHQRVGPSCCTRDGRSACGPGAPCGIPLERDIDTSRHGELSEPDAQVTLERFLAAEEVATPAT